MFPETGDPPPAPHPVVAYLEDRRAADMQARRRFRLRLGLAVLALIVAAVLVALVAQAVRSAPGPRPVADGSVHVCLASHYNAGTLLCTADTHALRQHEAANASISIEYTGPAVRHFIGLTLQELQADGSTWTTIKTDTTVSNIKDGIEAVKLVNMLAFAPLGNSDPASGRYRLRGVIDDRVLSFYYLDVYQEASPIAGPGEP